MDALDLIRARTPARLFTGRCGAGYPTAALLALRADHAAARDAVTAELPDLGLPVVLTQARDHAEYLRRPDRGRRLSDDARTWLRENCLADSDVQFFAGDGLSATAVAAQLPGLLPLLLDGAKSHGWSAGRPFAVRHCRVGVLNDVGDLLNPAVAVLLIGERPGLATAESLSIYLAYRPRPGDTDAKRNLISNIHARGVSHADAARRVLALVGRMLAVRASGVEVKEQLPALTRA